MTRGKYAARAAGTRAEKSEATADQLRERLETERAAHAKETSELKTRIERLTGQLTTAVNGLASDRVATAEAEAAEQLNAERAEHRTKLLEMFRVLGRRLEQGNANDRHYTDDQFKDLYTELVTVAGIDPGEAWSALASTSAWEISRVKRRETRADNLLLRQGLRSKTVFRTPR